MADDLGTAVTQTAGQAATVRVGTVVSVAPLQIDMGGTVLDPAAVGVLQSYIPQVGDPVILLGQSVAGAETSGSTWLAIGAAGGLGRLPSILKYGSRGTATGTTTTTPLPVLRIDDIPLRGGNQYLFQANTTLFSTVAANTSATMRMYFSAVAAGLTPVVATTASPLIQIFNSGFIPTTGDGISAISRRLYTPATDEVASLLMGVFRLAGTGLVSAFADGTVLPTELTVYDVGRAVPNTGVPL